MATETKLIELREALSGDSSRNGKFSMNLKQDITLNDGDQLLIRNVFIDSKKESNTINVPEDVVCSITFMRGINLNTDYTIDKGTNYDDWITDKHLYTLSGDDGISSASDITHFNALDQLLDSGVGNTRTFYPCAMELSNQGAYKKLTDFYYRAYNTGIDVLGVELLFSYTNYSNVKSTFVAYLKEQKPNNTGTYDYTIDDGFIIFKESDGITLVSPSVQTLSTPSGGNIIPPSYPKDFFSVEVSDNDVLQPLQQKIDITIPKGNYQPDILAQMFNLKLNNISYQLNTEYPLTDLSPADGLNAQVQATRNEKNSIYGDLLSGYRWPDAGNNRVLIDLGNIGPNNTDISYVNFVSEINSDYLIRFIQYFGSKEDPTDTRKAFGNPLMGGCSNFEIVYDQTTQTFKIPNLHTPYYNTISNVSNLGVKFSAPQNTLTLDSKRGEIKILSMTTDEAEGNFWFDKLGFDSSILSSFTMKQRTYFGSLTLEAPNFNYDPINELGISRTDAYCSSQILLGNSSFNPNYDLLTTTPSYIPTTDTVQIFGSKTINDIIVNDAYFKLVINGISTSNQLYNDEGIELISGIVGKYYSGQSYTNGFSSDGIQYIHRGNPITLSNFNVSILDSKNKPPNIGNDNSIILEVNKNIQIPTQNPVEKK